MDMFCCDVPRSFSFLSTVPCVPCRLERESSVLEFLLEYLLLGTRVKVGGFLLVVLASSTASFSVRPEYLRR